MIMNEYKVLGTVWFWALIALIAALHISARLIRGRKGEVVPVIANICVHTALFFLMFMRGADVSELLLALLISLSAALFCLSAAKKTDKNGLGKGE